VRRTLVKSPEDASAWIAGILESLSPETERPPVGRPLLLKKEKPPLGGPSHLKNRAAGAQITGFQAIGTSRYFAPSFSTCPIDGKVKWKPITIAFSAAAMS